MRNKQSSATAEGMALVRAIEAEKPESERICYDPIARLLIGDIKFTLSKLTLNSGLYEKMSPGAIGFITSRERYIDDFLIGNLRDGLEQVVILGAGFDTRAYRINGIEKTRVFEIDHPATQSVKLERLQQAIGHLPSHVTFVAVDFNTETLAERLFASGYCEQKKTLFIWQGVIMYLNTEGVDSTLAFIASHSGQGSMVIFDYFYSQTLREMKKKTAGWATRIVGEKLVFGIDEGQVEAFLVQRGFQDVQNADTDELRRLYFTGPNVGRVISPGVAIASAKVAKK